MATAAAAAAAAAAAVAAAATADDSGTDIKIGCLYWYINRNGEEKPVKVLSIDHALVPPSYCIEMQSEGGGEVVTRETEGHHLRVKPQTI